MGEFNIMQFLSKIPDILHQNEIPEDVLDNYRTVISSIVETRKRISNPVSLREGRPLKPATIAAFRSSEKELLQEAKRYRRLIKLMVKYNLLPTNKLISGTDRSQFIFTLVSMIMFPFLGEIVHHANAVSYQHPFLMMSQQEHIRKKVEYSQLIESLEKAARELRKKRPYYIKKQPQTSNVTKNIKTPVYSLSDYRQ